MPLSPRDRRALIIFGAATIVAAAVFFLFIGKGSKKVSSSSGGPRVHVTQPAPTPSPTRAKKQHKEVFVFSGRDPFDPAQGGGQAATPSNAPTASPGSNQAPNASSKKVGGKMVVLVDIFTQN